MDSENTIKIYLLISKNEIDNSLNRLKDEEKQIKRNNQRKRRTNFTFYKNKVKIY